MHQCWRRTAAGFALLSGAAVFWQTTVTTPGGAPNTVPKFSGTGTIVNSAITEVNGAVAIGTPLPYGILTVVPTPFVQDGQSTPANGIVFADRYDANNQWSHAAIYAMGANGYNGNLIFATDGDGVENFNPTEKMRIDPFGHVGVGTSTPTAPLEVNGNIKITTGGLGALVFADGSTQHTAAGQGLSATSSTNDAYILLNNTAPGGREFGLDSGSGGAGIGAGNFGVYDVTAAQTRLVVNPAGYVGINTISPRSQLEVNGDVRTAGSLIFSDGSSLSTASGLSSGGGGGTVVNAPSFPDIADVNGNVGVGTSTPRAKLDVAGVINGRNYSFPNYNAPQWVNVGTFTPGTAGATLRLTAFLHNGFNSINAQDSTYTLVFKNSDGISLDPNGFMGNGSWYAVGFNASIPNGSLKWVANAPGVNASSYTLYINVPSFANGSHYAVTVDQTSSWTNSGAASSDPGPASASVMIPNAEFDLPYGNMGVGTTAPSVKLEVNGDIKMSPGSWGLTFADGTRQTSAYVAAAGTSSLNSVISVAGGNVGIGTTTPLAKLSVANG